MNYTWIRNIQEWKSRREGIPIGHATNQGRELLRISPEAFGSHSLVVGQPRTGKTNALTHLAAGWLRRGQSLIAIDAKGDLVDALLGQVPRHRVSDVVFVDLTDQNRAIGLNPIQMTPGCDPDARVASVVRAARRVWHEHWDLDVEGLLTAGLYTLIAANQVLAKQGEPQFTVLDLTHLFDSPTFRRRLLNEFVHNPLLSYWWIGDYERQFLEKRVDIFEPFLNLLHIWTGHATTRHILGQSDSTVDLRQLVRARGILLVKTDARRLCYERGELATACLLEQLLSAIRDERANAPRTWRDPLPIFVDGHEPLIYPDHPGMLAELKGMGVTLAVATETLAELDQGVIPWSEELLASDPNLFVFRTNLQDAERLQPELNRVNSTQTE